MFEEQLIYFICVCLQLRSGISGLSVECQIANTLGLVGHLQSLLNILFYLFLPIAEFDQRAYFADCWLIIGQLIVHIAHNVSCLTSFVYMVVLCVLSIIYLFPYVKIKIKRTCRNNFYCNCYFVTRLLATAQTEFHNQEVKEEKPLSQSLEQ